MIKLFWNTHNQKKSNTSDKKIKEKEQRDYVWGLYHKKNSDLWIYEILRKIKHDTITSETNLEQDDILIIVDSSVEKKEEFYKKLKLICSKVFLFHLGDESGSYNLSPVYENCSHVWRTFCSNKYFENDTIKCLPIGFKSGLLNKKKIIENTNGPLLELLTNQADMIYYSSFQKLNLSFATKLISLMKKSFQLMK